VKSQPTAGPRADDAQRLATLIREQATDESTQARAAAREQAERIQTAAKAEVESIRTAAEQEGEARGRRRAAEILAVARAQQRMSLLQVRESLIETALAQAHDRLAATPLDAETLASLIREALPLFPAGPVRVRIAASDLAKLSPDTRQELGAGRWELRLEPDTIPDGGVVLESTDGRLYFDNSLAARPARQRDRLRRLTASILFPKATAKRNEHEPT